MADFNFVVHNEHFEGNRDLLGPLFGGEDFEILGEEEDMWGILVRCGVFPSRGQARKNWRKTNKEIPDGFSIFEGVGKKRHTITIWKPLPDLPGK